MMFKKRFKDYAKHNFDSIVHDPSFIKKENSIKKTDAFKKKLIPVIVTSLTMVLAGLVTLTIVVPTMLNNKGSMDQASHIDFERTFYVTTANNLGLAICEGIDYPEPLTNYKESAVFNVDIMIANLYYETQNDGTIQLLVGSEENPGYCFDAINISLNDSKKQLVKYYNVDIIEYSKQENGIENSKTNIVESDFKLKYTFNLLDAFKGRYDDEIYFEINYVENNGENTTRIFGKSFSFHLKKNQNSIMVDKLECNYQTSSSQIPDSDFYYMDVIDTLSNQSFDYNNPISSYAMIHLWDARIYTFDSSQTYSIISSFERIPLQNIVSSPSYKEELKEKMFFDSIFIEASFQYFEKSDNSEVAVIGFFVAKDGTLALQDNRNVFLYYSNSNAIDYDHIKELVEEMGGDSK